MWVLHIWEGLVAYVGPIVDIDSETGVDCNNYNRFQYLWVRLELWVSNLNFLFLQISF